MWDPRSLKQPLLHTGSKIAPATCAGITVLCYRAEPQKHQMRQPGFHQMPDRITLLLLNITQELVFLLPTGSAHHPGCSEEAVSWPWTMSVLLDQFLSLTIHRNTHPHTHFLQKPCWSWDLISTNTTWELWNRRFQVERAESAPGRRASFTLSQICLSSYLYTSAIHVDGNLEWSSENSS